MNLGFKEWQTHMSNAIENAIILAWVALVACTPIWNTGIRWMVVTSIIVCCMLGIRVLTSSALSIAAYNKSKTLDITLPAIPDFTLSSGFGQVGLCEFCSEQTVNGMCSNMACPSNTKGVE